MHSLLSEKITFFLGNVKTVKNLSYSGYFQRSVQAVVHSFLISMTAPFNAEPLSQNISRV